MVADYRMLAAIAVGLAVLLAFATIWLAPLARLDASRCLAPNRLRVGEVTQGRLTVYNRSRLASLPFRAVDSVGDDTVEVAVASISGGGQCVVSYPVPATRRGRFSIGPVIVERRDPFGFFRLGRPVTASELLWVHPRVHPALPLPTRVVPDYEGRFTVDAKPGTASFASLRDYVPGDDRRRIHWRSSARVDHLMVSEYVDMAEPATAVVLDNATQLDRATFEHAVEVAASIVHATQQQGRSVTLHTVISSGAGGEIDLLDRLAAVALESPAPTAVLSTVARLPEGGALVVITGGELALVARLAEQRRRFSPVVIINLLNAESPPSGRRQAGMAILSARTAGDAVDQWNRLANGELR
jgi:uncharacterized protein (DUF58 family)